MKKQTLLILTGEPLNTYYYKKYLALINQKNINVKIWNVLPVLNYKVYKNYFLNKKIKIYKNVKFKNILNLNHLLKLVKDLPSNFFFLNQSPKIIKSYILERYIHFIGGKKIFFRTSGLPTETIKFSKRMKYLISNLNIISPLLVLEKFIKLFQNKIKSLLEVKPVIYFVPNLMWKRKLNAINKNKIKLNHDYEVDIFNKTKKINSKKIIVFIDQMMERTFDSALYNFLPTSFTIKKDIYWKNVENVLDFLEKKTGLRSVVLAAHRRNLNDIPTKKPVIFDKTSQLIMQSRLVVAHNSTALHYAILYNKPIIQVITPDFKNNFRLLEAISNFTKLLNCKVVFSNDLIKLKKRTSKWLFEIDQKKYEIYTKKYLNYEKKNKKNIWTTLIHEIKNKKSILYNTKN